jgi:hypothetical protein
LNSHRGQKESFWGAHYSPSPPPGLGAVPLLDPLLNEVQDLEVIKGVKPLTSIEVISFSLSLSDEESRK